MTFDAYRALPGVNWTRLKQMAKSPLHYRHATTTPDEDTTSRAVLRLNHAIVLEPEAIALDFAVYDGDRRAGKAWEAFAEQNAHRTIVKRSEYEAAMAVRKAVRTHPAAARLLAEGRAEVTLQWTDAETGIACKGRADWIGPLGIVDLKGYATTDARAFGSQTARMMFHAQLAYYIDGWAAMTSEHLPGYLVPYETNAPHDVACFALSEDDLECGREEYRRLLRLVAECEASGKWPGRYGDVMPLALPQWAFGDDGVMDLDLDYSTEEAA